MYNIAVKLNLGQVQLGQFSRCYIDTVPRISGACVYVDYDEVDNEVYAAMQNDWSTTFCDISLNDPDLIAKLRTAITDWHHNL